MSVLHVFKIVQMVPNRAKYHYLKYVITLMYVNALKSDVSPQASPALGLTKTIPRGSFQICVEVFKTLVIKW